VKMNFRCGSATCEVRSEVKSEVKRLKMKEELEKNCVLAQL
jgi:hypothetical protein